jgi:spermidine/putrescine transport system ATP-binding protein
VMNKGKVEQVADPEEVYDRPTTTFVAGFIGVSNLMPATVVSAGELRLENGPTVRVDTVGMPAGEHCHAVVRPEKLDIEKLEGGGSSPNGDRPQVEGVVESSVYLGTATQMVVDLGNDVRITVLCANTSKAERQSLPGGGARVSLSWEPEHMHVVRENAAIDSTDGRGSDEVR